MNVLIVESKAKIKTIQKVLGRASWRVLSTGGHVECLPNDRTKHDRKEVKKADWAPPRGGLPQPPWVWEDRGEKAVRDIQAEAEKHDEVVFYLATDPDREGERIAWHLERHLRDLGPCHRVTFQEITASAIERAVSQPGRIDQDLVDAALVRVFVDRLIGWRSKNTAKAFIPRGTASMGRVQTPTLGFVVERELEREAHVPIPFFEVVARTARGDWRVRFHEPRDPAAWRGDDGKPNPHRTSDRALAEGADAAVRAAGALTVTDVRPRQQADPPRKPFETQTLLRAASSRFGWSMKKTNKLASTLYEAGHITYIRTDSTRLSDEAVAAGRAVVAETWGEDALGPAPEAGAGAGAQDAHEAVRPTHLEVAALPDDVDADARKLYTLIRARTLAALMAPARRASLSLSAHVPDLDRPLRTTVSWFDVAGWRVAFTDLDGPPDTTAVTVAPGEAVALSAAEPDAPNPLLREDATKPPPRYSPAALVKQMKESGIGRPSTYVSTVDKLLNKKLVEADSGLKPTEAGRGVWLGAAPLFVAASGEPIFETDYTRRLEETLDAVARGEEAAPGVWLRLRDTFKASLLEAQAARKSGQLTPKTRARLEDFLAANAELAAEAGDLDALTEAEGLALAARFRQAGAAMRPSEAQQAYLDKLLTAGALSVAEAAAAAGVEVSEPLTRADASALIDHLQQHVDLAAAPSPRQLRMIRSLAKKADLDEAAAAALVGAGDLDALTGGRGGTASALIDLLLARTRGKKRGAEADGAAEA